MLRQLLFAVFLGAISVSSARGAFLRNAIIPIMGAENQGIGVLKLSDLSQGYRLKGFFRIGTLPTAIITGLTIEVEAESQTPNVMRNLWNFLERHFVPGMEIHGFKIVFKDLNGAEIRAESATVRKSGSLDMEGITVLFGNGGVMNAARGSILLHGQTAGDITIEEQLLPRTQLGNAKAEFSDRGRY